jgi:hypothetical protein
MKNITAQARHVKRRKYNAARVAVVGVRCRHSADEQLSRPIPSDVRELGKQGRPKKGEEKGDNDVTFSDRGNSTAYTLAKNLNFLRRDLI